MFTEMKSLFYPMLGFIILMLMNQVSSQHRDRFMVNIVERMPPFFNTTRFMCSGTVVAASHVLTTAKCVEDTSLRIDIQVATVWTEGIIGWGTSNSE
jgi:uncharacterized membrane protein YczE